MVGGAGGTLVFALSATPLHITIAMGLIGVGCSPVLMGSYFIFARIYDPKIFASLASIMIGVGSLGNLAGAAPLALIVELTGWRSFMLYLGLFSILLAAGLYFLSKTLKSQKTWIKEVF